MFERSSSAVPCSIERNSLLMRVLHVKVVFLYGRGPTPDRTIDKLYVLQLNSD